MRSRAFPVTHVARLLAAALIAGSAFAAQAASFDLSPEQPARQRGAVNPAVEQALPAGFRFAEANTLTIGIAPNLPPLSTYATDARTVVGFDPDLAQLIADSLGRKLKIVPLAWADWPLALQSGKVDTIFSVNSMLAYQASLRGDAKLIGTVSGGWPRTADIAITTRKGSGLAEPLTLAINALIANGSYRKALDHWRLDAEAIDRSQTNPPGLPRT